MRQTLPDAISVVSNYNEIYNLIRNRCGNASRNHLKIGTFKPEDAKRWPEFISNISSKGVEQSYENLRFWCQGAQGGLKINQMVPRRAPKAILEASRFWDPQKVSTPRAWHTLLCTIWAILGAILGTPGRQGVPKIKSSGTKMLQNIKT